MVDIEALRGPSIRTSSAGKFHDQLMAYDQGLAERLRLLLIGRDTIAEKSMFGGLAFLDRGNMLVGVVDDDLVARVGKPANDEALALAGARPMDFTGREMKGWIYVAPEATVEDSQLEGWVDRCIAFVDTLPSKT